MKKRKKKMKERKKRKKRMKSRKEKRKRKQQAACEGLYLTGFLGSCVLSHFFFFLSRFIMLNLLSKECYAFKYEKYDATSLCCALNNKIGVCGS